MEGASAFDVRGYTIVLFTTKNIPHYAPCQTMSGASLTMGLGVQPLSQHPNEVSKQVTTLLEATATLRVDLQDLGWSVIGSIRLRLDG